MSSPTEAPRPTPFTTLDGATQLAHIMSWVGGLGELGLKVLLRRAAARVFQSLEKLEEALKRPDFHLGPPPANLASAGRMNALGLAVFYGATHADVAIAEGRPPVASHVLVGRFEVIRPLKLLDVEASFLAHLRKQITLPVMPDDEPLEYLVRQAIADYLANLAGPVVDGLVYRSIQHDKGKNNIVLFHKAARVRPLDIPPKTYISAHAFSTDEDGPYPEREFVPKPDWL